MRRGCSVVVMAAAAAVGGMTVPSPVNGAFIVESNIGGQNFGTNFFETGAFSDSTAKSTAPGTTPGIRSRFTASTNLNRMATFHYTPAVTALYAMDVTWPASTNGAPSVPISHTSAAGTTTANYNQNQNVTVGTFGGGGLHNTWVNLASSATLNAGVQYTIKITTTGSSTGGLATPRILVDSARWSMLAPDKASGAAPADDAGGVGAINGSLIDVTLNWLPGTINNHKFDVYFGASAGSLALISDDQGGTSLNVSGLNPQAEYFWRIDSQNAEDASATGDVWSFTTAAVPEPGAVGVVGGAGAILLGRRRRG